MSIEVKNIIASNPGKVAVAMVYGELTSDTMRNDVAYTMKLALSSSEVARIKKIAPQALKWH